MANSTTGSATGYGAVTVNSGGMLAGTGIVSGSVSVNLGGAFVPGNPLGVLTLSNNLTLATGSTTFIKIKQLPLTNNVANILGTLSEGGTLNVTNIGGIALASGDSFNLFKAGSYTGAFTNFVLPALGANLAWNTSALQSSGTISVITINPPVVSAKLAAGKLVASGSGAPANWTYYVLATTNLLGTNWTRIATNQTDGSGNFSATNGISASAPQTFFRLQF